MLKLRLYKVRALTAVSGALLLSGLSGCASSQSTDESRSELARQAAFVETPELRAPASNTSASKAPPSSSPQASATELDPQVMYEVMLAEWMVLKGAQSQAFSILYPLAQQTRDPGLAQRVFQLSMATYDLEAIQAATDLWRKVAPESEVAWKATYLMSVRQGSLKKAQQDWRAYRQHSQQSLDQDLLQGALRIIQTTPADAALPFLKWWVADTQQHALALYGYGLGLLQFGQPQLAITKLEQALKRMEKRLSQQDPAWPALLNQRLAKADAASQASDSKTNPWLLDVYRQANIRLAEAFLQAQQPRDGLDALADYIESFPKDWAMQERYARLEVNAGFLNQAEQRYQSVVSHRPDVMQTRLALALLQMERGDVQAAWQQLEVLESEKNFVDAAQYYKGRIAQSKGRLDQAQQFYQAVTDARYALEARLHLAEIVYQNQGLQAALNQLAPLDPKAPEDQVKVLRAQAMFYRQAGQTSVALEKIEAALALAPDNIELMMSQARLYYGLKRFEAYERTLKQALEVAPNHPELLNALGYFYVEQGQALAQATQLLDKAIDLAPGRYHILDSRGWLAYKLGHYEQAQTYLRQALSLQLDPEVLAHLIEVLWQSGEVQAAKALWQKHQAAFPEHTPLQTLLSRLQNEAR